MKKLTANKAELTRLFKRILVDTRTYKDVPCWNWTGAQSADMDYAFVLFQGDTYPVHRLFYCLFVEHVQQSDVIDHLCRNTLCVNPVHLEAVTQQVNVLRGVGLAAENAKKTHCPQGHELSEDNLSQYALRQGRRACRTCLNERAHQPIKRLLPQKQEMDVADFQALQKTDRLPTSRYLLARIFSKTDISVTHFLNGDACWEWTACIPQHGYGQVFFQRPLNQRNPNTYLAHKMMYELFVGAVPEGFQVGHACALRSCVNPAHLICESPSTLNLRPNMIGANNAQKTHCPKGHALEGDNLVKKAKGRACRICANHLQKYRHRERRAKQKASGQKIT